MKIDREEALSLLIKNCGLTESEAKACLRNPLCDHADYSDSGKTESDREPAEPEIKNGTRHGRKNCRSTHLGRMVR